MFVGYCWFPTALGWHIERAPRSSRTAVKNHGLGNSEPPSCDAARSLVDLLKYARYLWADPAGRCFPPRIEETDALTVGSFVDCHIRNRHASAAEFFEVVLLAQKCYVEPYKRLLGHEAGLLAAARCSQRRAS